MLRRLWPGWRSALILVTPEASFAGIELVSCTIGLGFPGIVSELEENV
jgi:hypothetical protein